MIPINPAAILVSPTAVSAMPPNAPVTSRPAPNVGAAPKSQPQILQRLQQPALDAWHRPETKTLPNPPELPAPPDSLVLRLKDGRPFDQRYTRDTRPIVPAEARSTKPDLPADLKRPDSQPEPADPKKQENPTRPIQQQTPLPNDERPLPDIIQRLFIEPPRKSAPAIPELPQPDGIFKSGPPLWIWTLLPKRGGGAFPPPWPVPGPPAWRPLRLVDPMAWPVLWPAAGPLPDTAHFYPTLRDGFGNTLLMYACAAGNTDLVAFLLDICPPAWAQALNVFGLNAAMIARDNGHAELLPMLAEAGAELQPENPALQWYLQNRGDLVTAIRGQDWQPLAALLAQDHFMNLRDPEGRTLLFHAVIHADLDAIRFLCGCLDSPFVGWKDVYGNSVFRYTARIPNVQTGAAICQELRTYRRRMRWQHQRRPRSPHDVATGFATTEPVWSAQRNDAD